MNSYCSKCNAFENCNNPCIQGFGDINAPILFIGETTGSEEDHHNVAIYNKEYIINYMEKFSSYYYTNAIKCKLADKKGKLRKPTGTEIDCCKAITFKLINEIKPKVIVAMGSLVLKQLLGINMNIDVAHGKEFFHPYFNCYIIPTWDSTSLLEDFIINNGKKIFIDSKLYRRQFSEDIQIAMNKLRETPRRKSFKELKTISNPVDVQEYLKSLLTKEELVIDLETTGLDAKKDSITDIGLATSPNEGVHITWKNVMPHFELLKKVLESGIKVINHNIRFDAHFLMNVGIQIKNMYFDTMLAYHTITMGFEGSKTESLYKLKVMSYFLTTDGGHDSILNEFGGIAGLQTGKMKKKDDVIQESLFGDEDMPAREKILNNEQYTTDELDLHYNFIITKQKEELKELGLSPVEYYTAMDANITFRIYKYLKTIIDEQFPFSFYEVTMPMNQVLFNIEENGIMLDYDYMDKVAKINEEEMDKISKTLFKEVKMEFNISSPKQIVDMMQTKLKIKPDENHKTPKGDPSTDDEAIKFYSQKKPVLNYILSYRELAKQNSVYLKGFKEISNPVTHRVYPSYLQHITATSRCSCVSPSLHTTPRDNKIRNMIIPKEGHKLVLIDLSQIELRVIAQLANDKNMMDGFNSGVMDVHSSTACKMFGIDPKIFDKSNPDHGSKRTSAKEINFGIIYLMSSKGLSAKLKNTVEESQHFINMWFDVFPGVKNFIDETRYFILKNHYVETLYGRRRQLPYAASSLSWMQEAAIRQGTNCRIQSPASDIFSMGVIKNQNMIDKNKMKTNIVGLIHDATMFESPEDEIDFIKTECVKNMITDIPRVNIKLEADVQILSKWEK